MCGRDERIDSDQNKVTLYTPSNPKSSPCYQGMFPNPLAYDAAKMIIDSSTMADQICEQCAPVMSTFPVCSVMAKQERNA